MTQALKDPSTHALKNYTTQVLVLKLSSTYVGTNILEYSSSQVRASTQVCQPSSTPPLKVLLALIELHALKVLHSLKVLHALKVLQALKVFQTKALKVLQALQGTPST
jgi:hypothetical protein